MSRSSDQGSRLGALNAAQLFVAYADAVASWASRLGGPAIDVEDVVQEVFIVVHRRLARFRGDASVTTWLFGITNNIVYQQRRKARRRHWFGRGEEPIDDVAPQPTPIEELERHRRAVAVYRVLERMRESHRTVLILSELEGLSGEEIATLTGLKLGTVWVRLHRARAEFSQLARKLIPDEIAAIESARSTTHKPRTRSTR
jgi:RNA polymerase sigma-70 factor (ECF subfamily)